MPRRLTAGPASSLMLVAILAAAANMRIGIVSVGPLVEDLRADLNISSAVAGALTTIPFLCSGVFAFVGESIIRALGVSRTMRLCLLLIGVGTVIRASATGAPLLLLATVPIGIGIAWMAIVIAQIVKLEFATRADTLTGAYIAAMSGAAAVVGVLMVPLQDATGSWRWALALTAIPAFFALAIWLLPDLRSDAEQASMEAGEPGVRPFRRRSVVTLAVIFGFQSICFTTMIGWVAAIYQEAGWSDGKAALATISIPVLTVVAALLIPTISNRANRRTWVLRSALLMAASLVLVALTPTSVAPLWLLAFGLSSGSIFPLVMTLPLDLCDHPAHVGQLTGWMLGIGYLISSIGPMLAGSLRDTTGSFEVPLLLIAAMAAIAGLLARSRLLDAGQFRQHRTASQ